MLDHDNQDDDGAGTVLGARVVLSMTMEFALAGHSQSLGDPGPRHSPGDIAAFCIKLLLLTPRLRSLMVLEPVL